MSRSRTLSLGEQRIDGVWFMPAPVPKGATYRLLQTDRNEITHVSTDDLTQTGHIRNALIDLITGATEKVLFCSFLFADDLIVDALCEAAERLRGGVYVLTALGKHLKAEVLALDEELDEQAQRMQVRAEKHEEHLRRLAHAGVWLRSAEDCHAKFCTVDDRRAVVTSANATREAYELNPEDGLVLKLPSLTFELSRLFAHVWRNAATLESTPGAMLNVRSLRDRRTDIWRPLPTEEATRTVATLRGEETSLLNGALEVIERAQERLRIATYSFIGMKNHPIGKALEKALERGVQIDLLLRPRNHIAEQRRTCAWLLGLAPEQVRIFGHRRTHTKSIVADGEFALLWTGNLEAAHGWDNGIEVGALVQDPGVARAIETWISDVMERRTHLPEVSPTVRYLVSRGHPQKLPGEWSLSVGRWTSIDSVCEALEGNPVEFQEGPHGLSLRCGEEIQLNITLDEDSKHVQVERLRRGRSAPGTKGMGWLAETWFRIEEGTSTRLLDKGSREKTKKGKRPQRKRKRQ